MTEDEMITRAIGDNPYDPRPAHTRVFDRLQARQTHAYMELEKDFQQRVTDLADAHGWDWQHCRQPREDRPGFPDLVLWHRQRGVVLFRELKRDGGELTHAQMSRLSGLIWAGANAHVWFPSDWPEIEALLTGREEYWPEIEALPTDQEPPNAT